MIGIIIGLPVLAVVNAILAALMNKAAVLKGYGEDYHIWAACFWLGIFGCLYAIALPDKIAQNQNQQIIDLMKGRLENETLS